MIYAHVGSAVPKGLCPLEYPARSITSCGQFRGWNPVSYLHSSNSSGRLHCTTPHSCGVSPRNRGTCNSLPYHTSPSRSCALRINAITRPCSLSYFWSYHRIFANNVLLTVRDYNIGILVQESTIVAVLPRLIFLVFVFS